MSSTRTRAVTPRDPVLIEIDDWCTWFVNAHRARLAELQLAPEQHARERDAVTALAGAIHKRMTDDYLARRPR